MNGKIMSRDALENIEVRLDCCHSLLDVVRWEMEGKSKPHEEALFSIGDLLEMICRDLQAEIDTAKDYIEKTGGAA